MLSRIKGWDTLCSQLSLFIYVIGSLFCHQPISNCCSTIILRKRHGQPILERLVVITEDVVNEVKAIVKHLLLSRVSDNVFGMESVLKVITYVDSNSSHSANRSDGEQSRRMVTNRFLSW